MNTKQIGDKLDDFPCGFCREKDDSMFLEIKIGHNNVTYAANIVPKTNDDGFYRNIPVCLLMCLVCGTIRVSKQSLNEIKEASA